MKLEVGKKYKRRGGGVAGPMMATHKDHPYYGNGYTFIDENGLTYKPDGSYSNCIGKLEWDLVAPLIETKFVVGEFYTSRDGYEYLCIAVNKKGAYLTLNKGSEDCAYLWDHSGKSVSLSEDYDINFETTSSVTTEDGSHRITFPVVDGVPDLTRATMEKINVG